MKSATKSSAALSAEEDVEMAPEVTNSPSQTKKIRTIRSRLLAPGCSGVSPSVHDVHLIASNRLGHALCQGARISQLAASLGHAFFFVEVWDRNEDIEQVRFSPNGRFIAYGFCLLFLFISVARAGRTSLWSLSSLRFVFDTPQLDTLRLFEPILNRRFFVDLDGSGGGRVG